MSRLYEPFLPFGLYCDSETQPNSERPEFRMTRRNIVAGILRGPLIDQSFPNAFTPFRTASSPRKRQTHPLLAAPPRPPRSLRLPTGNGDAPFETLHLLSRQVTGQSAADAGKPGIAGHLSAEVVCRRFTRCPDCCRSSTPTLGLCETTTRTWPLELTNVNAET